MLYAYLEAYKLNPRYNQTTGPAYMHFNGSSSAVFDNAADWYMAPVTDDPT